MGIQKNMAKLFYFVKSIAPLMLGIGLGAGLTLVVIFRAEIVLDQAIFIGIAAGSCAFVFFLLIRFIVQKIPKSNRADNGENVGKTLIKSILERVNPLSNSLDDTTNKVHETITNSISVGISYWSATVALGIGIAAVGAVIAMVTALSSIRQVDRIDAQNRLIEQQIFQAKATRISSVFSAQLPSLLTAIDNEREDRSIWQPSRSLVARIQAAIDVSEPFSSDPFIDTKILSLREMYLEPGRLELNSDYDRSTIINMLTSKVFSPQRGQLLQLLIASGLDFRSLVVPLDFSHADLSDVVFTPRAEGTSEPLDLGRTILKGANLRGAKVANVDLSSVDLAGAILPSPLELSAAITWKPPNSASRNVLDDRYMQGPNFSYAILIAESNGDFSPLYRWTTYVTGGNIRRRRLNYDPPEISDNQTLLGIIPEEPYKISMLFFWPRVPARSSVLLFQDRPVTEVPIRSANELVLKRLKDDKCDTEMEFLTEYIRELDAYSRHSDTHPEWVIVNDMVTQIIGAEVRAQLGEAVPPISDIPYPRQPMAVEIPEGCE